MEDDDEMAEREQEEVRELCRSLLKLPPEARERVLEELSDVMHDEIRRVCERN